MENKTDELILESKGGYILVKDDTNTECVSLDSVTEFDLLRVMSQQCRELMQYIDLFHRIADSWIDIEKRHDTAHKSFKALVDLLPQIAPYEGGDTLILKSMMEAASYPILKASRITEMTIQEHFKLHLGKYLKGASLARIYPKDDRNIPDAWVIDEGMLKPVEVKLDSITGVALRQIQRYMDVFGCDYGVVVAQNLRVKLPENIKFVKIDITDIK